MSKGQTKKLLETQMAVHNRLTTKTKIWNHIKLAGHYTRTTTAL